MVVLLVGKDTLKISEAYINAFPAFSCPLFASKNPIVHSVDHTFSCIFFRICVKYSLEWTISVIFQAFSISIRCFSNFWIQTGNVATLVGKTTFSPLVWPCFQFSSKKLKNIEFQWKKLENQLRLLFYLVVTRILKNIQGNKYHNFFLGYPAPAYSDNNSNSS